MHRDIVSIGNPYMMGGMMCSSPGADKPLRAFGRVQNQVAPRNPSIFVCDASARET